MNIPLPIFEIFITKGEMTMVMIMSMMTSMTYIHSGAWQLIPMDHLFLSIYRALLMLLRKQVLSRMVALSGPIPTLIAWYSGWILVC